MSGAGRGTVATSVAEVHATLAPARDGHLRVGLVPTLGALHEGHVANIKKAKAECDLVVVSIFLNPLQFEDRKDLARYPGDTSADSRLASGSGADVVFSPSVEEMYPQGPPEVVVDPGPGGLVLEGAARPGHFRGVVTVVTKLFAILEPSRAYFGEKDYQQLVLVRRLVSDLSIPVRIVACSTIREPDGLALSSRNALLSREERSDAAFLYRALVEAKSAIENGERDSAAVVDLMASVVGKAQKASLQYAKVVREGSLAEASDVAGDIRLLIAARVGAVHLIDNMAVDARSHQSSS